LEVWSKSAPINSEKFRLSLMVHNAQEFENSNFQMEFK
jgi:hypothetical protein